MKTSEHHVVFRVTWVVSNLVTLKLHHHPQYFYVGVRKTREISNQCGGFTPSFAVTRRCFVTKDRTELADSFFVRSEDGDVCHADASLCKICAVQFQGDKIRDNPSDTEYHMMLMEFSKVRNEAVQKGMSRYELYARALRLSGFGLAHLLNWNQSEWGPQDMGFAPTPRGKRLMTILQMAGSQQ